MRIERNQILALNLALLLSLSAIALTGRTVRAEDNGEVPATVDSNWRGIWYKFETPLVTLIFPAGGKKPMFLWWYTKDNRSVYVMKFKGIIEYLTFDLPYYDRRYPADNLTLQQILNERYIEPRLSSLQEGLRRRLRETIMDKLLYWLMDLHSPNLPFSACTWKLDGPVLLYENSVSYWAFNFTLKSAPGRFEEFVNDNVQIRCRFYNTSATETFDHEHNYEVAAGQLKFDFVVSNWEWNIDKIKEFAEWLNESHRDLGITLPPYKAGLALWINLALIKIEDFAAAENDVQNEYQENVETNSRMQAANINDDYCTLSENETQNRYEHQIRVTSEFRHRTKVQYAKVEGNVSGFLEFVPWARRLRETGDTVAYENVTASCIAAGGYLRLFICYPYFGADILEHDPTIGLAATPATPTLVTPTVLAALIVATVVIAIAVAAVKVRKKTVNIVSLN